MKRSKVKGSKLSNKQNCDSKLRQSQLTSFYQLVKSERCTDPTTHSTKNSKSTANILKKFEKKSQNENKDLLQSCPSVRNVFASNIHSDREDTCKLDTITDETCLDNESSIRCFTQVPIDTYIISDSDSDDNTLELGTSPVVSPLKRGGSSRKIDINPNTPIKRRKSLFSKQATTNSPNTLLERGPAQSTSGVVADLNNILDNCLNNVKYLNSTIPEIQSVVLSTSSSEEFDPSNHVGTSIKQLVSEECSATVHERPEITHDGIDVTTNTTTIGTIRIKKLLELQIPVNETTHLDDTQEDLDKTVINEVEPFNEELSATNDTSDFPISLRTQMRLMMNDTDFMPVSSQSSTLDDANLPYRLHIVQRIWEYVIGHPHLHQMLAPDDFESLNILFELPQDYQRICFHLYTRQSKWHRIEKFVTSIKLQSSDTELHDIFEYLECLQLVLQDYQAMEKVENLMKMLLLPELHKIAKVLRIKLSSKKKRDIIKELLTYVSRQRTVAGSQSMMDLLKDEVAAKLGRCVKLDPNFERLLFRMHLLYRLPLFHVTSDGELYQYIREVENGTIVLPTFNVTKVEVFASPNEFNKYAEAAKLYFDYVLLKERATKSKVMPELGCIAKKAFEQMQCHHKDNTPTKSRFNPTYIYAKLLTTASNDLTKQNELVKSWLIYLLAKETTSSKRGEWYVQLAMHFERYDKNVKEAIELLDEGLKDPYVNLIDKTRLSERAISLVKRKKLKSPNLNLLFVPTMDTINVITEIRAKPFEMQKQVGSRVLYRRHSSLFTVEEIAKAHYCENGYPKGVHCEGSLMMTLMAAFFWDCIYADIEGAFISSMQYIPLDFFSQDFYVNRKDAIDARLNQIETEWNDDELYDFLRNWEVEHSNKYSVHTPKLINETLVLIESIACLTRSKVAKILDRLIKDVRQFQAGMPDLFVWNPDNNTCLFAEVKSENDVLSMKQKEWIRFLQEIEVPVELCRVNYRGKSKRIKKDT